MTEPETAVSLARAILSHASYNADAIPLAAVVRLARLVLAEADHRKQMVKALRTGILALADATGTLEARWEARDYDKDSLPPPTLRAALDEMDAALRLGDTG